MDIDELLLDNLERANEDMILQDKRDYEDERIKSFFKSLNSIEEIFGRQELISFSDDYLYY